jgi:Protein of unknown function (DUF3551)
MAAAGRCNSLCLCAARPDRSLMPRMMRAMARTILAIATMLAASSAEAQRYDPSFPVCLQTYGMGGGNIDCSFTSLPQCNASALGRAAQCLTNPFFAHPTRKQVGGMGRNR